MRNLSIVFSLVALFFLSCDWATSSQVFLYNDSENDVELVFYKDGQIVDFNSIAAYALGHQEQKVQDQASVSVKSGEVKLLGIYRKWGPPQPTNPFAFYDFIEIIGPSGSRQEVREKDFSVYKKDKYNAIYFFSVIGWGPR